MIYLGLDLGSKTLGLAISDRTGTIASALEVLRYNDYDELLSLLERIVIDRKANAFVLGNPLNMNGSESDRSKECIHFKELLENKFKMKVYMQDERLSTVEAQNMLIKNSTRRSKRKKVIDKIAAVIILQGFLDRRGYEK